MADSTKCKRCEAGMRLQSIGAVSGEQGVLKVTFPQLPALVCPNGHKRFAVPEFPIILLDHLAGEDETSLPSGKTRGLIFKDYRCGSCGAKLAGGDGQARTFGFDIRVKDIPAFRVELTAPVYKCPSCAKEQLRSLEEIQMLTAPAMAHAFEAAGLKPE
ncbi:MAG: hypothetical protein K2Y16_11470 [Burkholderiales bacterium]|nr:hypothetical protein [Burkholderiales bacterium]